MGGLEFAEKAKEERQKLKKSIAAKPKEEPEAMRKNVKKRENAVQKTKEERQPGRKIPKKKENVAEKAKQEPAAILNNVKKSLAEKAKEKRQAEHKKREDAKKVLVKRMKTIRMTRQIRKGHVKKIIQMTKQMRELQSEEKYIQKQLTRKAVAEEKWPRTEDLHEQLQGRAEMAKIYKDKYFDACEIAQCVEEKAKRSEEQLTESVLLLQANKTRGHELEKALKEAVEKKKSLAENHRTWKKHTAMMFAVLDELVAHIDDIPAELREKVEAFSKCELRTQTTRTGQEEDAHMATAVERLLKKERKQKLTPAVEKTKTKTVPAEAKKKRKQQTAGASKEQKSGEGDTAGKKTTESVDAPAPDPDEASLMEKVEKLLKQHETTLSLTPSSCMLDDDLAMTPSPEKQKQPSTNMDYDDDSDRLTIVIEDSDDEESAVEEEKRADPFLDMLDLD